MKQNIAINDKDYTLMQDAYCYNENEYHASAVDENGNSATIVWGIAQEWIDAQNEYASRGYQDCPCILEDEGNALDWDNMQVRE